MAKLQLITKSFNNYIGLDSSGTSSSPNRVGIDLAGAKNTPRAGNYIYYNQFGITI